MSNAKKAGTKTAAKKQPRQRTPWNASEILYSVFGYLTTRKQPLILSGHHDAGAVAEFLGEVCRANNLPATREGSKWKKIHISDAMETITNLPPVQNAVACGPAKGTQADPLEAVMGVFKGLAPDGQNKLFSDVFKRLKEERKEWMGRIENDGAHLDNERSKAIKATEELHNFAKL